MFLVKKILAALVLPPAGPALLALLGLWLSRAKSRGWQRAGTTLAAGSLVGLLGLSLPVVGNALTDTLHAPQPVTPDEMRRAQAIVILGGGAYHAAPEYGGDTVSPGTLVRLRYGAKLARETGLPLLLTGGSPFGGRPEAESMRQVMEGEFGTRVRWMESASRDTEENARLSAPLLQAAGIRRVALVTHASHMRRARELFQRQGIDVIAAPTGFDTPSPALLEDLLPRGLGRSRDALHEHLGLLYNRLGSALP